MRFVAARETPCNANEDWAELPDVPVIATDWIGDVQVVRRHLSSIVIPAVVVFVAVIIFAVPVICYLRKVHQKRMDEMNRNAFAMNSGNRWRAASGRRTPSVTPQEFQGSTPATTRPWRTSSGSGAGMPRLS